MPAALTHYLMAKRMYNDINGKYNGINIDFNAFIWGAQGADFLFAHRLFPWQFGESLKKYGSLIHNNSLSQSIDIMKSAVGSNKENKFIISYVLGFICHHTLDNICHPFVKYGVSKLNNLIPYSIELTTHTLIETNLDIIMLRYQQKILPTDFNMKCVVPKDLNVYNSMIIIYSKIFKNIYNMPKANVLILQAIKDYRFAISLTNDKTTLKKDFLKKIEKLLKKPPYASSQIRGITEDFGLDYANTLHKEWNWPLDSNTVKTDSFFELYEEAILKSKERIYNF